MKYLVKLFVVTLLVFVCTHATAEQKVAFLDMKFILNNSKAGKGAQDYLKKKFKDNQKKFSDQEILDRYLAALINTGAHVLEEGLAMRGSDIDVIWNYGYGFPRYRGGPMFYADQVGLDKIYKSVCNYNTDYGDWLRPSILLERLASEGGSLGKYSID